MTSVLESPLAGIFSDGISPFDLPFGSNAALSPTPLPMSSVASVGLNQGVQIRDDTSTVDQEKNDEIGANMVDRIDPLAMDDDVDAHVKIGFPSTTALGSSSVRSHTSKASSSISSASLSISSLPDQSVPTSISVSISTTSTEFSNSEYSTSAPKSPNNIESAVENDSRNGAQPNGEDSWMSGIDDDIRDDLANWSPPCSPLRWDALTSSSTFPAASGIHPFNSVEDDLKAFERMYEDASAKAPTNVPLSPISSPLRTETRPLTPDNDQSSSSDESKTETDSQSGSSDSERENERISELNKRKRVNDILELYKRKLLVEQQRSQRPQSSQSLQAEPQSQRPVRPRKKIKYEEDDVHESESESDSDQDTPRPGGIVHQEVEEGENDGEGDDDDDNRYEVEFFWGDRIRDNVQEYFVKWLNYDEFSWEPYENVKECTIELEKYWRRKKSLAAIPPEVLDREHLLISTPNLTGQRTQTAKSKHHKARARAKLAKRDSANNPPSQRSSETLGARFMPDPECMPGNPSTSTPKSKRKRASSTLKNTSGPMYDPTACYEVDKILEEAEFRNKRWVLIQWQGFPCEASTWEPVSNLVGGGDEILKEWNEQKHEARLKALQMAREQYASGSWKVEDPAAGR